MEPAEKSNAKHPPSQASLRPSIFTMISRGSAPSGTFDIPEEGLPVPHNKSFFARFQDGIPVAKSALQKYMELMEAVKLVPTNEQTKKGQDDEDAEDTVRVEVVHSTEKGKDKEEKIRMGGQPSGSQPAPEQIEMRNGAKDEQPSSLEIAADVAEDSLIEVVDEQISVLSDRHPSYPVLRFCAANALLDGHALDTLGLPLGFVWAPFGDTPKVARVDRDAIRCGTCGSFLTSKNGGDAILKGAKTWTCCFCGRDENSVDTTKNGEISATAYPELGIDVVEYAHVGSSGRNSTGRGAIVLIVDENVEEEEVTWARAAIAAVHASAKERGLKFALLTVGAGCSVATGETDDDGMIPVMDLMSVERAKKLTPEEKEHYFLRIHAPGFPDTSSVQEDSGVQNSAFTDVFIRARMTPGTEELAGELGGLVVQDNARNVRTRLALEKEQRRLDLAINVAFELISGMADAENSRVLCLVTGPPTFPPQASINSQFKAKPGRKVAANDYDESIALARLYEEIGIRAGDLRIALDFLCFAAPQGFASPVLLGAAKRSKGGMVHTAVHGFSAASSLAEAATYMSERSTVPGVVSIRVSTPLSIARVIGPAFPTAAPHTYAVPGIDPVVGFTVILKPKFLPEEPELEEVKPLPSHAVIQLAAKSLKSTRVITVQVPVTMETPEYLNNLDTEVSALVLGKACVVSGGALTQPLIAARSIDLSARRLLRGSETAAGVVRLLFELRRGLLIDRQINPDCGLVLRSFFLRGECAIASLLMSPRLFTSAMSDEGTGLMAEVPLEKSHISKGAVLVLDTGYNVFVYVGEEASAAAEEAISESARSVAAQRLSPCQLWKIYPGPDADYLLDWYLSPSDSRGVTSSPTDRGFIPYCKSLAPESITVQLLQSM